MTIRCHRRRASVYIALLMTALIVSVIGVSGVLAARVQFRAADGTRDMIAARFCAESAIELALLTLSTDLDWHTSFARDVWTDEQPIGRGTYAWMLSGADSDPLEVDPSLCARLYGKGTVGDAVRIYSVLLTADEQDTSANNLLTNGGMEAGVAPWTSMGCGLEIDEDEPHGGSAHLLVSDRADRWDGPRQEVSSVIAKGSSYDTEVWVRLDDYTENVRLVIWLDTQYGYYARYIATGNVGTEWTLIHGTYNAMWSGELYEAWWEVETEWSNQEFEIDDAWLAESSTPATVTIVPLTGTWRRDVDLP